MAGRAPTWRGVEVPVEIGRGRTARVYVEYDEGFGRHVAVKRLAPEVSADPHHRRALAHEARITARLVHPNIPRLYRVSGDELGLVCLTLELVEGLSFSRWLSSAHPLGTAERSRVGVRIVREICDAAAHAHDFGILHLDVKPDNVMVADRGRAYLLDWSVSRFTHRRIGPSGRRSQPPGGTVGTPGYLAPEQARGDPKEITERSDVFGLGALLYQVITGTNPYGDLGDAELLRQARLGRVVAVERAARGRAIPACLVEIAHRATEPSPADRYATVRELRAELVAVERSWARSDSGTEIRESSGTR